VSFSPLWFLNKGTFCSSFFSYYYFHCQCYKQFFIVSLNN
jgi:hypothetical protein